MKPANSKFGLVKIGITSILLVATMAVFSGCRGRHSEKHPNPHSFIGVWHAEGTSTKDKRTYAGTYTLYDLGHHDYDLTLSDGVHKTGHGFWSLMEGTNTLLLANDTGAAYIGTFEDNDFSKINMYTVNNLWTVVLKKE